MYRFWGWEHADVLPADERYAMAGDPRHLYDLLSELWSADTCAPRLRSDWSRENQTLGQCSITAFLVQDIYGGKVYGVALSDGNFHCYNVIGDCAFDLTSEQFGDEVLCYTGNSEQSRETHFSDAGKYARYLMLKQGLEEKLSELA